jgi:hypothetical protein
MESSAWACDSCHTNNYAEDRSCRVCGLAPGSATGTIKMVSHEPPPQRPTERPLFVASKHAGAPDPNRSTIFLTPPPPKVRPAAPKPAPKPSGPPRPVPMPTRPDSRRRTRGWVFFVVSAFAAIAIIFIAVLFSPPTSSVNSQGADPTTSPPSCPGDVAQYLPEDGPSVLIGQYNDDANHVVTICQDTATSQYYYDGKVRGAVVNNDTHISLAAIQTGAGFVATNGAYQYEINGTDLTVSENGIILRQSKLTQTAP